MPTSDLKIAAAYIRVSTDDQEEYSPDSQVRLIREYARKNGYLLPEEYVFQDDGISAATARKRPAFNRMIALAKEKERLFDAILVLMFSRFARNREESVLYKGLLRKQGISVISVKEPAVDGPFGTLIESIIEWFDEYYLINLSAEVKRGMSALRLPHRQCQQDLHGGSGTGGDRVRCVPLLRRWRRAPGHRRAAG